MTLLDRLADTLVALIFLADRKWSTWGRITKDAR